MNDNVTGQLPQLPPGSTSPDDLAQVQRYVDHVRERLEHLRPQSHVQAICLDCGDTLVDEGTEIKDENEVVQRADLIPGADDLVHELKRLGYTLALVADGPRGTFENVLRQHGLYDSFDAFAISGDVGTAKPAPIMFHTALRAVSIPETR